MGDLEYIYCQADPMAAEMRYRHDTIVKLNATVPKLPVWIGGFAGTANIIGTTDRLEYSTNQAHDYFLTRAYWFGRVFLATRERERIRINPGTDSIATSVHQITRRTISHRLRYYLHLCDCFAYGGVFRAVELHHGVFERVDGAIGLVNKGCIDAMTCGYFAGVMTLLVSDLPRNMLMEMQYVFVSTYTRLFTFSGDPYDAVYMMRPSAADYLYLAHLCKVTLDGVSCGPGDGTLFILAREIEAVIAFVPEILAIYNPINEVAIHCKGLQFSDDRDIWAVHINKTITHFNDIARSIAAIHTCITTTHSGVSLTRPEYLPDVYSAVDHAIKTMSTYGAVCELFDRVIPHLSTRFPLLCTAERGSAISDVTRRWNESRCKHVLANSMPSYVSKHGGSTDCCMLDDMVLKFLSDMVDVAKARDMRMYGTPKPETPASIVQHASVYGPGYFSAHFNTSDVRITRRIIEQDAEEMKVLATFSAQYGHTTMELTINTLMVLLSGEKLEDPRITRDDALMCIASMAKLKPNTPALEVLFALFEKRPDCINEPMPEDGYVAVFLYRFYILMLKKASAESLVDVSTTISSCLAGPNSGMFVDVDRTTPNHMMFSSFLKGIQRLTKPGSKFDASLTGKKSAANVGNAFNSYKCGAILYHTLQPSLN